MISKMIHILLSLPSPKEEIFKDTENIFLWKDKPHTFKLSALKKLTAEGGLQF